ncbi:MAG: hypothetical protein ACO4CH_11470 [Saprospiraceae bacterium]
MIANLLKAGHELTIVQSLAGHPHSASTKAKSRHAWRSPRGLRGIAAMQLTGLMVNKD